MLDSLKPSFGISFQPMKADLSDIRITEQPKNYQWKIVGARVVQVNGIGVSSIADVQVAIDAANSRTLTLLVHPVVVSQGKCVLSLWVQKITEEIILQKWIFTKITGCIRQAEEKIDPLALPQTKSLHTKSWYLPVATSEQAKYTQSAALSKCDICDTFSVKLQAPTASKELIQG